MATNVRILLAVVTTAVILSSAVAPLVTAQTANNTTATPSTTTTETPTVTKTPQTTARTTTATTTESTRSPTPAQCTPGPSEPQLAQSRLYAPEKTIESGSPGQIAGGFQLDPTSKCSVTVHITLRVPSGMQITGASDTFSSGAGMTTATFTVNPTAGIKDISAEVYSRNTGERTVTADITYWPVGHKEMAKEMDGMAFTYDVREAATPTPASGENPTNSAPSSVGFVGGLSDTAALIAALFVLLLAAIVGLAARSR